MTSAQPTGRVGINSGAARETVRDGVTTWRSPDGITLATQDGFLIATRGLGGDMLGSDIRDAMAVVLGGGSGRVTRFHTFLDGENNAVRRAYVCDIRQSGPSEVQLNQQAVPTRLITEDCASQDQQFVNLYWQDRRGQIIQSQQWAGEFTGGLTFRIVP